MSNNLQEVEQPQIVKSFPKRILYYFTFTGLIVIPLIGAGILLYIVGNFFASYNGDTIAVNKMAIAAIALLVVVVIFVINTKVAVRFHRYK